MNRPPSLSFGEFARQLREMRKLGPITRLLKNLPKPVADMAAGLDEEKISAEFDNIELLAAVMTPEELQDPTFVPEAGRLKQLAAGAEVPLLEVELLFQQLEAARRFLAGDEPPLF